MASATERLAARPQANGRKPDGRPGSSGEEKGIWSRLLDSVASGRKLPEKRLVVLGGTSESQAAFVDALSQDPNLRQRPAHASQSRKPPFPNEFALGYTYQDILDVDHDDILARLSLYLLADYSPAFASLLSPLFEPSTIPNTLIVILLDWENPALWLRQLRSWIRLLLRVLNAKAKNEAIREAMDENMAEWRAGRKGVTTEGTLSNSNEDGAPIPPGAGAWDEPLGVPLCVVCQNAEKTEKHEKERGWKDEEFDFILQYMRTILLKHGASLIYTASAAPGFLRPLIHSTLGIQSLLQRNALKHNITERDKVLIPPNWDSWGIIRVMREGFDVESVSKSWSLDISLPSGGGGSSSNTMTATNGDDGTQATGEFIDDGDALEEGSCIPFYEETLRDQSDSTFADLGQSKEQAVKFEIECMDNQEFLKNQQALLETLQKEDDREQKARESRKAPGITGGHPGIGGRVNEHIGPVQFNLGGIQVDADDMLKGIKDREAGRNAEDNFGLSSPDGKLETEKLQSFFAGLAKPRGGSSSPATPK